MNWDGPDETRQMHPALETLIVPRTRDLGDGFEVRRALPSVAAPDGRALHLPRPDGARGVPLGPGAGRAARTRTSASPP